MKISKLFAAVTILFAASAVIAQTAKTEPAAAPAKLPAVREILENYVKAIGGREANQKITRRVSRGTVEIAPMGLKGSIESIAAAPDRALVKMSIAGIGDMLEGFDGTTGWSVNPIQGSRTRTGDELRQTKLTSVFHRDLNLEKLYPKMELKGVEKVGTQDAYVIVGTAEGLPPDTFYFDRRSGLLVRTDSLVVSPEGNMKTTVLYDDYRNVDGVMVPHRIHTKMAQMEVVISMSEVKHGGEDKAETYRKPTQ